jgi:hypothetical protein
MREEEIPCWFEHLKFAQAATGKGEAELREGRCQAELGNEGICCLVGKWLLDWKGV